MSNEEPQNPKPDNSPANQIGIWLALGVGIGVGVGAILGNAGAGLGLGIAIGGSIGALQSQKTKKHNL